MWRIIKLLVILLVLVALGVIAYAYVGPLVSPRDFSAPQTEVTVPVPLDLN